jgi:hypothetical protein
MYFNKIIVTVFLILFSACSQLPEPPKMTVHEQLKLDTVKAQALVGEFENQVQFESQKAVTLYLSTVASQLTGAEEDLRTEKVSIRIHQDTKSDLKRPFSFPGVLVSIPKSFLLQVNFENELAALIALELAQVKQRDLALELEKNSEFKIFGPQSVFNFSRNSRGSAIEIATRMMYGAGFDFRGVAALIQKYPYLYLDPSSPDGKSELEFYIKQAQKAKNGFMPSLQPIVRSNSFLQMKKNLKRSS